MKLLRVLLGGLAVGIVIAVVAASVAAASVTIGGQSLQLAPEDPFLPSAEELLPAQQINEADLIDALRNVSGEPRELKAPRPGWFDEEVARRQKPGGVQTAPVDAPLPGQIGIRPGSMMVSPFICTMNFIFQKSSTLAIGTAGHCLEANEPVTLLTVAPGNGNPVLVTLGKVLLKRDGGIGNDYGLVEIPPSLHGFVFPTIAGVGGPCGVYSGGNPQPVAHYGHGLIGGTGGTPRVGMGVEVEQPKIFKGPPLLPPLEWNDKSYSWVGEISNGDSGSPVRIAQLPAVGNLTHGIGLDLPVPQPSVLAWGTRVTTITGSGWTLLSSPLCPP
jgi:hypothetical protein